MMKLVLTSMFATCSALNPSPQAVTSTNNSSPTEQSGNRSSGKFGSPAPGLRNQGTSGNLARGTPSVTTRQKAHRDFRIQNRAPAVFRFWGLNGSGTPQAEELMDRLCASSAAASNVDPVTAAIFLQEHQKKGDDWKVWQERACRRKWISTGAPATRGAGGGTSAGVAVLSPRGKAGSGALKGQCADVSPTESPGLLTAAFLDIGPGLLCLSAYFWTGRALTDSLNVGILSKATSVIEKFWGGWGFARRFSEHPGGLDRFWLSPSDWWKGEGARRSYLQRPYPRFLGHRQQA